MKRCEICVDPQCGGKQNCNCLACPAIEECHRVLRPIVRITTKCTQACSHCAFECSPQTNDMMSVETAKEVNTFFEANNINYVSIMGGEFWLNPDWYEIAEILTKNKKYVRIVTNGDWIKHPEVAEKILEFCKNCEGALKISLSKDKWHHNKNVEEAASTLEQAGIYFNVATEEETTDESIVPVGRSQFEYNLFASFSAYCTKPDCRYVFLITEEGDIPNTSTSVFNRYVIYLNFLITN